MEEPALAWCVRKGLLQVELKCSKVYITGRRFEILEKVSGAWDKQMDVTDKESILKVKAYIEEKEGKLHVLVNKFVR